MNLKAELLENVQRLIVEAQAQAVRAVDAERVRLYWHLGQLIVEEEQHGADRAAYGTALIKGLAAALQPQFGSGFSGRQLHWYVQFFRTFPNVTALRSQFSWTHYRKLIQLDNEDKREFYVAEAAKNNWSARQLERQVNSQLFERLLLSNDVAAVLAVARQEQPPTAARAIIKDPMVLEFLGLKREAAYYERDLETALITHLQEFLLELGNGFSFVARQQRLHLDGDDFFVDLVFYNRLLQCFVLIEIKTDKLTHQDLGQLQMYVNYYDRLEKLPHENPTIGILLCADKNDAVVKISLPADNQTIVASKYQLYLPTEQALLAAVQEEIDKLDQSEPDEGDVDS
jgi:predicted nuclease of restriction endonuclease-like (RecB) superfamily